MSTTPPDSAADKAAEQARRLAEERRQLMEAMRKDVAAYTKAVGGQSTPRQPPKKP